LSVDLEKLSVYWRSKKVDLSLSQVHMIHALVEKQGRVVSFAGLMRAADICVEPNTVTAHVRSIRNSFKSLDPEFAHIESVRGMGYRWLEG
jgi:two-component system OmpR family response regulator